MKRIFSVLLVLAILLFVVSGCAPKSTTEIANALNKTNGADSMNYTMDVATSFSIGGLYEALSPYGLDPDQLSQMLNQIKITYDGSVISDKKTGNFSAESGFTVNIPGLGLNVDTQMWQKIEDGNVEQIVKMPQLPFLATQSKEYTVNNLKADDAAPGNAQMTKIFNDFILENAKDEKYITKIGDKHYTVHVDKDKGVVLIGELLDAIKASTQGEISSAGISIDQQYEQVKDLVSSYLGDKGIDVELVIGDDGYITQEIVSLDLNLNTGSLAQALTGSSSKFSGMININLKMDTKFSNYNSVSKIGFPEVNDTNAVFNNN